MGMNGEPQILGIGAHLDAQRRLCDQVAGVGADNAGADGASRFLVKDSA